MTTYDNYIKLLRSDMSNWLIHFTKYDKNDIHNERYPFKNLNKIIEHKQLNGNNQLIRGDYKCICFSEAPLAKAISIIEYSDYIYNKTKERPFRYAPFGIAVKKEWLYNQSGRPVIYQSEQEYSQTFEEQRYRHVRYEPNNGIDFTWEREWRIKCGQLSLQPEHTTIIVKNKRYREQLLEKYYAEQSNNPFNIDIYPWGLVSLDELS